MTTRRFFNFSMGALILWALLIPRYAVSQDSVQIDSAEITQVLGVQKDNHRNFVAGKSTAVRAFLKEPAEIDSNQTGVKVLRDGAPVFTLAPKSTEGKVSSVDFLCAPMKDCQDWKAGTYTFVVAVNGAPYNVEGSFDFVAGSPIRILAVPVKANYGKGGIKGVTGDRWKTLQTYTEAVYPLASGGLEWTTRQQLFDASSSACDLTKSDWSGCDRLTDGLIGLIPAFCKTNPQAAGCYDFVVGFIPESVAMDNGDVLAGWTPASTEPVFVVVAGDNDAAATVAHELAHKYGIGDTYDDAGLSSIRCSVNPAPDGFKGRDWDDEMKAFDGCTAGRLPSTLKDKNGNPINGAQVEKAWRPYEPLGRGALPEMADFMSASASQNQFWITQDSYDWLYRKLVQKDPAAKETKRILQTAVEQRFVSFSGTLSKTGEVRLEPWESYRDTAELEDTTGATMVLAIDNNGNTVASAAFTVEFFMVHPPRELIQAPLEGVIRFPPETLKFQIVKDGAVLAERPVSAFPPVVGDVTPRTPATLDGPYTVTWTGSDPDQDTVTYTVSYNPDVNSPGSPWLVLADDISAFFWEEDFSLLPGGAHGVIRVTAGDGVLCTSADSVEFNVPFKEPEVFIGELPWGTVYRPGSDILLAAEVIDLQDESIPDNSIVWTSNISGELGTGEECIVKNLPVGEHIITATAVNSAGLAGTDTVAVTVSDGGGSGGSSGGCFIDSL